MFSGIKEHYKAQITHSFTQLRKNMQFVPVVETQNKNIQIQIIFLSMRQTLFFFYFSAIYETFKTILNSWAECFIGRFTLNLIIPRINGNAV